MEKIRLGISACLLGHPVRYDAGHRLDPFLACTLGQYVDFVPVCPETELGLGVPREPLRLTGGRESPGLVIIKSGIDISKRMKAWARRKAAGIEKEGLSGFIFKARSPSCGTARVNVYPGQGRPIKQGGGLFARIFMERFPLLPVAEEEELHDPAFRENFIERIFALRRWRECLAPGKNFRRLIEFHTAHKLLLLAHSERHYRRLGRLIAAGKTVPVRDLYDRYQALFLEALSLRATSRKHANVLQHMMGYFKKELPADEKRELLETIDLYRRGVDPLIVPLTLLRHYVRKYDQPYLLAQIYLNPDPLEVQLRNHA